MICLDKLVRNNDNDDSIGQVMVDKHGKEMDVTLSLASTKFEEVVLFVSILEPNWIRDLYKLLSCYYKKILNLFNCIFALFSGDFITKTMEDKKLCITVVYHKTTNNNCKLKNIL